MLESRAGTQFFLLNDLPVQRTDGEDVLGTQAAAVNLAALIEASRDSTPFTLGIDAGWGMGKSSLMLQIQEELGAADGMQTVWFNAWTAEGAGALNGLIKSVLLSLDENTLRRALRKIVSRRQLLAALRIGFILVASYFHLKRVVDEVWDRLSVDARSRNQIRAQIADMFAQWSAKSTRSGKGRTLVVFIDDLDRCSDDVMLEVCEAMKLYLDVPGIAFVVGCDQDILGRVIATATQLPRNVASSNYMEKIIQVTYNKPAPYDSQISRLIDHYAERSGTREFFNDSVKKIVVDRTGRNPRRIKRLINSFVLEYQLDPDWRDFGAEALIGVILMRQFYADFYRAIANPAVQDTAAEFLAYRDIRSQFQLGSPPSEAHCEYFRSHNVRPPGDAYHVDDLRRLEEQLPVSFPALARDEEFVSLLRGLSERQDFGQLRQRLQRQLVSSPLPALTSEPRVPPAELTDLAGLRILWIDDNPELSRYERAQLAGLGASVDVAPDADGARERLREQTPDVLISDIARGERDSAGLDDLRALLAEGLYDGPRIFFTGRVTPARRRRAEELGALITTAPRELIAFVRYVAESRTAVAAGVPAPRGPGEPGQPDMRPGRKSLTRAQLWSQGQL